MTPALAFVRAVSATNFAIVMRDSDGFESVIDSAKNGEMAEKKAARWRVKEARANARST